MDTTINADFRKNELKSKGLLNKGIRSGFIGGLVGTLAMDIVLMTVLPIMGRSPWTCFLYVGNTMAAFFNIQVTELWKVITIGIATHYFIGPVIGLIFGVLAASSIGFRNLSHKKRIAVAVIFIEILSQPLLASTPILLNWNASITLLWYAISFFMHFIMGLILGVIVSKGLGFPAESSRRNGI